MMTLARDQSGNFWQIDGLGPLIEVDMKYDRRENMWLIDSAWQNDVPYFMPDDQREEIERWHDANIPYEYDPT